MKSLIAFIVVFLLPYTVKADQVKIAVASNFIKPMKALIKQFEQQQEHIVLASYGSSGKLFAQISHGAPFDIFLSADQQKPNKLVDAGLAEKHHQMTYAQGKLYLWSKKEFAQQSINDVLSEGEYMRLALANPKLAPYGKAATSILKRLGLITQTQSKWVMGENIGQVFSFVAYGSADLGFVAKSQLLADDFGGTTWKIPKEIHPEINQDALLLKRAENNAAALAFWQYLQSEQAEKIIHDFGYETDSPE